MSRAVVMVNEAKERGKAIKEKVVDPPAVADMGQKVVVSLGRIPRATRTREMAARRVATEEVRRGESDVS